MGFPRGRKALGGEPGRGEILDHDTEHRPARRSYPPNRQHHGFDAQGSRIELRPQRQYL